MHICVHISKCVTMIILADTKLNADKYDLLKI